jgi:hypothetical protein
MNFTIGDVQWRRLQDQTTDFVMENSVYIISNVITLLLCLICARICASKEDYLLSTVKKEFKNIAKVKETLKKQISLLQNTIAIIFYVKILLGFAMFTLIGILIYNTYFRETNIHLLLENRNNLYLLLILLACFVIFSVLSWLIGVFLRRKQNRFNSLDGNQIELAQNFLKGIGPDLSKLLKEHIIQGENQRGRHIEYLQAKLSTYDCMQKLSQIEIELYKEMIQRITDFGWCSACYQAAAPDQPPPAPMSEGNGLPLPGRLEEAGVGEPRFQRNGGAGGSEQCQMGCLMKYFELSRGLGKFYNERQKDIGLLAEHLKTKRQEEAALLEEYRNSTVDPGVSSPVQSNIPTKKSKSEAKKTR